MNSKESINRLQSNCKIIGSGLIGQAFEKKNNIEADYSAIIFASGVSNSLETDPKPYLREKKLLESIIREKKETDRFVYFSTMSVYDNYKKDAAYVRHKLQVEDFIKKQVSNYLIVRVPNIVGKGGNPATLLNYLVTSVLNNTEIKIFKNAYRNFVDVEDLVSLVKQFITSKDCNKTIDLLHPVSYSMVEVMKIIEKHTKKTAKSIYTEQGYNYFPSPNQLIHSAFESSNVEVSKDYLSQILAKYY